MIFLIGGFALIGVFIFVLRNSTNYKWYINNSPKTKYQQLDVIEGLSMSIKQKNEDTEVISISINNTTNETYYYGLHFDLEILVNDEWLLVPPKADILIEDIEYILEPNTDREFEINLKDYAKIMKGHYRNINNFYNENNNYFIEVPFSID